MKAMHRLIRVELVKIWRRRLNWITLGVVLVLIVTVYVLLWVASGVIDPEQRRILREDIPISDLRSVLFLEDAVPFALTMLYEIGLLGVVVVVGANVGSEYAWNTLRTNVAAYPDRIELMVAKLIALGVAVVAGMLVGLVVSLLTSTVITVIDGGFTLEFVDLEFLAHSLYSFLRLLLQGAPYFALAVLGATWGRSATSGISIAVGFLFLEAIVASLMTLAGGWVSNVPDLLLSRNADSLSQLAGGTFRDDLAQITQASGFGEVFEFPDPLQSGIVLAVWTVVFTVAALVRFHRQDLGYQ